MSRMSLLAAGLAMLGFWAAAPVAAQNSQAFDTTHADLHYRMVGPARGGRVTTVMGVPSQPRTFYMGVASGGLWKTTDAGVSWVPISDGQIPVGSTGSVDVSRSDPNIVYLGTGSKGIRSNVSIGRGVYKSTDAGATWQFVGLREVGQIAAVRIDPTNPDIVFVAAVGNPFTDNVERGVFRTRDGGKTWKKVLYVSDSVGSSDLELQPGNPNVIYAGMWHGQRKPWTIDSGSRDGGLYRSTDGGEHWTKLGNGLPSELIGKSNLTVTAANPQRVYALIEAKPGGGLYRSDDAGQHWTLATSKPELITRPFYYTTVVADPTNADVVYAGAEGFFKSTDAGKTFSRMPTPHGDNHDMWINPNDGKVMIQANDGGANISFDGGRTWSTQYNQPTVEFYGVVTDNQFPYRLYGAQQDNTTLIVPSLPLNTGQVEEWRTGPGCETGPIMPNPGNPDIVYGACKGQFSRMSLKSGQEQNYWVGAQSLYGTPPDQLMYRFQRTAPMEVSPYDANVVYYGSQYVHRTRDQGVTWERISPDLTAHDPRYMKVTSGGPITRDMTGEEMYATLYAIRESPLQKGLIWTGANDGPVYVTQDDGKTWTNITPKDLPPGGRVQYLEPSPHRAGSAYIAVYRYLMGDFAPYIYRTDDYGKSWTRLTDGKNGIPADDPTRVVREDPSREGLLYAGTEFGMYVSFDNGAHWEPFQLNLPVTPVTDITVHAKDLVVATQGRSFWILDDLTPLHQWNDAVKQGNAHLFQPRDAYRMHYQAGGGFGLGPQTPATAAPQYPPPGAMIDYYFAEQPSGKVTLEILDASGKIVRSFAAAADGQTKSPARGPGQAPIWHAGASIPAHQGVNRFIWDLAYPAPLDEKEGGFRRARGPTAVPGAYSVRLTVTPASGGTAWTATQPLVLKEDPRSAADGVTLADLQQQFEHNMRVRDLVSEVNLAVKRLEAARASLKGATSSADKNKLRQLDAIAAKLETPPVRYSEPQLQGNITYLYGMTNDADQKIGQDAITRYQTLRTAFDEQAAALQKVLGPAAAARDDGAAAASVLAGGK